jgi:hypothetical protein
MSPEKDADIVRADAAGGFHPSEVNQEGRPALLEGVTAAQEIVYG